MSVFHRILVPVDFGASSRQALEMAVSLARCHDAQLTALHVFEVPTYIYPGQEYGLSDMIAPLEQAARSELERMLAEVRARYPAIRADLRRGAPWQEILAAMEDLRADLIVMGTHGRRGVAHVLIGSVAEKIVRLSPVPVLTVRAGVEL